MQLFAYRGDWMLQTEGSASEYGKGPSIWDYYVQKFPGGREKEKEKEKALSSRLVFCLALTNSLVVCHQVR